MGNDDKKPLIEKLRIDIPEFDHVSKGGLPKGRTTLITGTAGIAKTVFCNTIPDRGHQGIRKMKIENN